jgi:hypothetical protein
VGPLEFNPYDGQIRVNLQHGNLFQGYNGPAFLGQEFPDLVKFKLLKGCFRIVSDHALQS